MGKGRGPEGAEERTMGINYCQNMGHKKYYFSKCDIEGAQEGLKEGYLEETGGKKGSDIVIFQLKII